MANLWPACPWRHILSDTQLRKIKIIKNILNTLKSVSCNSARNILEHVKLQKSKDLDMIEYDLFLIRIFFGKSTHYYMQGKIYGKY